MSQRSHRERNLGVAASSAAPTNPDYGLLASVATVPSPHAVAVVQALLKASGIRSTVAPGGRCAGAGAPGWEILVFVDAAAAARAVLTDQLDG